MGAKVYAITDRDGYVKIGIARNPESRRDSLQTGNAQLLEVIGHATCDDPAVAESHIHDCMRRIGLIKRGEWLKPCIATTIIASAIADDDISAACQVAMDFWCMHPETAREALQQLNRFMQIHPELRVEDIDDQLRARGGMTSIEMRRRAGLSA
jgi:hypothetical protein